MLDAADLVLIRAAARSGDASVRYAGIAPGGALAVGALAGLAALGLLLLGLRVLDSRRSATLLSIIAAAAMAGLFATRPHIGTDAGDLAAVALGVLGLGAIGLLWRELPRGRETWARTEALASLASRRFELAIDDSPVTVFEQDPDLRYTFVHNPPAGTLAADFLGRTDHEVFSDRDMRTIEPFKRQVIASGIASAVEIEVTIADKPRYFSLRLEPTTDPQGAVVGVIGTALDLTERRLHEQNMLHVMRELTHRSKNLLAVVQAMARKTASLSTDTDGFVRDFSSRLRAISAAHDLLAAESWSGAGLRHLLDASLSQAVDPAARAIDVSGPDVKLPPDAAQMLALAFHELTTNAVRYGALSSPGGRISVRWGQVGSDVRLRWREAGGPAVCPPHRSGFGRLMIERLVGDALDGTARLDFRPEGLVCDLTFPETQLTAA